VDATDAGADLDEEVVLMGRQGSSEIRAEELAEKTGTISYEIVSRINPQIPRIAVS
jgi:alanine racemase